jgi:hypothetical protein
VGLYDLLHTRGVRPASQSAWWTAHAITHRGLELGGVRGRDRSAVALDHLGGVLVQPFHERDVGHQHQMSASLQGLRDGVVARFDDHDPRRRQESGQGRFEPADGDVEGVAQRSARVVRTGDEHEAHERVGGPETFGHDAARLVQAISVAVWHLVAAGTVIHHHDLLAGRGVLSADPRHLLPGRRVREVPLRPDEL